MLAVKAALEAVGSQFWPSNRADYERSVASVRAALNDADAFEAAWSSWQAQSDSSN